jgi:hypothetical protein
MEHLGTGDWVSIGIGVLLIGYGVREILTGDKRRQAMIEAENASEEYAPGAGFDTKPDRKPSSAQGYLFLLIGVVAVSRVFL